MKYRSNLLKICLFATGLSGIVAEYVLSTLATYFLGNSVFQWTIIVSIMLFAMGLGSRLSKFIEKDLLKVFIYVEYTLSILTAFSSLAAHLASTNPEITGLTIYTLSIAIGLLIGMEIPLVIRINDAFESLKVNVSSILENDYYGSLMGGMFFAFIGLPYIGLTYTPFILGLINFSVALVLLFTLWDEISSSTKRQLSAITSLVAASILAGLIFAPIITRYTEDLRYQDRVILSRQSRYQKIVITQSDTDYWLFINGNQQLSTMDEWLYHEPLVHPAMLMSPEPREVLIMGGGDGCAAREVLKHSQVERITVVDLDPVMTQLASENYVLTEINHNAFQNAKVSVVNRDGFTYLENDTAFYDVIIIDLPDPKTVELGRLYSKEFYSLCYKRLRSNGVIITQAGSPYFAPLAFECIEKTMLSSGFSTLPLHNHVYTMGEWGWVLGTKNLEPNIKKVFLSLNVSDTKTRWLKRDHMERLISFGKPFFKPEKEVEVNTIQNPVLFKYYRSGRWDLY